MYSPLDVNLPSSSVIQVDLINKYSSTNVTLLKTISDKDNIHNERPEYILALNPNIIKFQRFEGKKEGNYSPKKYHEERK